MYNTTKNFEKAILGDNRTFRAKIKTGKYETEDGFISIKHYMKSVENSITVGGAVSSYVEVEMWKPDFFVENSELQIFIGIDVEDEDNVLLDTLGGKILDANSNNILTVSSQEKTEWIPLGLFTAQKPKNDNEIVTFTAYDRIESKLSGAFFSDLKYPIDAKKILEEISQKTGVPINISDLPNGVEIAQREVISESDVDEEGNETTTTTYENPFNGYTYREALGYIAMLYCRFAIADRTGTIKLVWYTDANYEVNTDRYYDDLVTQDEIFMVSKISCAVGEKTIYAGDGTTSILLENPVMTQERLDYIYNTIKELNFLPASTSFYGDIRLDIGDIVTLNDKYGNVIKIPLMSVTQEFDGGLLTAIQSYGSGEESTQSGGQITKMVNRTYTELFLVKEIVGTKASFDYVRAKIGEFEELSSNFLKVNDADIKYAKIDLANVNNAWIENGQIKKASITNAEIADATIESAKIKSINADTINTGTLKTKHLIIVSDDGKESIVGVINASNGVPEGEVNSKKIQAASIDVVDLSAFQAKIAGFNLKEYAIYADKQSATGKDGEIYLSTDRLFMGVGAINMDLDTPFQVYANGSFRLVGRNSKFDFNSTTGDMDIEVSKLKIASKSVATSDDIANLMNERTTVLKIESSNGAPLDENSTSTVLHVIIYRGRTRITNALDLKKEMGEVSLLWLSRKEREEYKSISANDNRISDSGFTFTPSEDDVKNRCSFRCRLISDGSGYINPDQATAVDRIEAEGEIKLFDTKDKEIEKIQEKISQQTTLIQDINGWQFRWDKLIATDNADEEHYTDYIQFVNGNITIGNSRSNVKLNLTNELINFTDTDGNELARFQKNAVYLGLDSKDSVIDLCNGTGTIANANTDESHNYNRLAINSTDSIELNSAKITKIVSKSEDGHFISTIGMNAGRIPWSTEFDTVSLGSIVLKSEDKESGTSASFTLHPVGFQYEDGRGNITSAAGSLKIAMNDTEFIGTILKVPSIFLPNPKLSWLDAKNTLQCIVSSVATETGFYPVARINTFSGNQWLLGGLNDKVYVAGQYAGRTESGIDWYTIWSTDTGLLTHSNDLQVNGKITSKNGIVLENAKYLFAKNNVGEEKNILGISSSNNVAIGYECENSTNIYGGNRIRFAFNNFSDENGNISWNPYYIWGDTISVTWDGAGYITGGKTVVRFSIPLARPILGNPTVTVSNVNGLRIRQNGKYLFGSSADSPTKKGNINASANKEWVRVEITYPADDNAINNDVCGIEASIKITFE